MNEFKSMALTAATKQLLQVLEPQEPGEGLREGLQETPARVAKAWDF